MKKTLRCPSCDQRIRVEVPESVDRDWVVFAIFMFGTFVVVPLVVAAVHIWGTR